MEPENNITARILSSLAGLPIEEAAAILALIGAAVKTMSVYRMLEIRQEITAELDTSLPVVGAALDLIDGQIALREIAGDEGWR